MKMRISSPRHHAFNSLDMLVMLLAVAVVVAVGIVGLRSRTQPRSRGINCINNLKQIGLSFRMWGSDNGDKFPSQVSTNAGGTMELLGGGSVFPIFAVMSNELGTTKIMVCGLDTKRQHAADFGKLTDTNLSYFVVPEADELHPNMILSGDCNLTTNNVALKPGLFAMTTNRVTMGWTSQIHQNQGNVAMADGSVQRTTNRQFHQLATNSLAAVTNGSFQIAIP